MNNSGKIPVVWQISVLELSDNRSYISGVLLKSKPFSYNKQSGSFNNLVKVVRSYFTQVYSEKEFTLTVNKKHSRIKTDRSGAFSIMVNSGVEDIPEIRIGDRLLEVLQTYPVVFPSTDNSVDIISDIDDTILVSYTASFFKRIGTLVFTSPEKRKSIEFTQTLFNEIIKLDTRFFYVSKSESNLFAILSFFIRNQSLPGGPLFLTPYLSFSQMIKGGKEKEFKEKRIRFLMENYPDKKYILFGDDTQKDMKIYSEIVKQYPNRIGKIYIRQTRPFKNKKQEALWKDLKEVFPGAVYFNVSTNIVKELKSIKKYIELQDQ